LNLGAQLQIEQLNGTGQKFAAKFIGCIKGNSILISLPIVKELAILISQKHSYVIRGFNGKHAYAFTSRIIHTCSQPVPYAHFSYPLAVEGKIVRKALRVNVELPASVTSTKGEFPVTMMDLSAKGSMIKSPQAVGEISDMIDVQFDVAFEEIKSRLTFPAKIRNACYSKDTYSIHIGVEFTNIPQNDMLILNNFIHATSSHV
jgi:hypothetical protein